MYRVVIADDDFSIRNGLAHMVKWQELGFEVKGRFEDGRDVIAYMEANEVDVVFTDVEMYEISGLEVAKWVAVNRPGVIVVVISGYKEFEYVKEALRAKVFDYILKPVDLKEVEHVFVKLRQKLDAERAPEKKLENRSEEEIRNLLSRETMVQNAKDFIAEHIADELNVDVIADSVCFSRSYFAREFRKLVGLSVMDYVIKARMEHAIMLLGRGETSQKKIAASVGYQDLKYFQRSFKKHTGHTVKDYLRLIHSKV